MREAQKMLLDTRSQATQFVGLVGQVGLVRKTRLDARYQIIPLETCDL